MAMGQSPEDVARRTRRWRPAPRRLLGAIVVALAASGIGGSSAAALHAGVEQAGASAAVRSAHARVPRPVRLLEIGDSLGEDLGYGLVDLLGRDRGVELFTKAVGDTGLSNAAYYNWPAQLGQELAAERPQVVVVFLGANDVQGLVANGRAYAFDSAGWRRAYAQRVAEMVAEVQRWHARLLWVGMPIMASAQFSKDMTTLNAFYRAATRRRRGVAFLPTWKLFSNAAGQYAQYLPGPNGGLVAMRGPDGIHIAPPYGDERVAHAVIVALRHAFGLRL